MNNLEEKKIQRAMDIEREEVLETFKKVFSYSFFDEVEMILFHTELYSHGLGFSVSPHEDILEEAPLYYNDQGNPIHDDIDSGSIDVFHFLDMESISQRGDAHLYINITKPLFAQWLHERWKEAGGEQSLLQFALTYQDYYPSYYDLRTMEYHK